MKNQLPNKINTLVRYCYTAVVKGYIDKMNKTYSYNIDVDHYAFKFISRLFQEEIFSNDFVLKAINLKIITNYEQLEKIENVIIDPILHEDIVNEKLKKQKIAGPKICQSIINNNLKQLKPANDIDSFVVYCCNKIIILFFKMNLQLIKKLKMLRNAVYNVVKQEIKRGEQFSGL